jgi:hypothetical protein
MIADTTDGVTTGRKWRVRSIALAPIVQAIVTIQPDLEEER